MVNKSDPNRIFFAIHSGTEEIGLCSLSDIQKEVGFATVSLVLDPGHRGKGIGKEAFNQLKRYAKEELGLKAIIGSVKKSNKIGLGFWKSVCPTLDFDAYPGETVYFGVSTYD